MNNVVNLIKFKKDRDAELDCRPFQEAVLKMDKVALLEEMVKWQELRTNGDRSLKTIACGRVIFGQLVKTSSTPDMQTLASSMLRQLENEFNERKKA